ncbi:MAG: BrnT family toxin [Alphaproteobacteria bacterium]
MDCEWDEAKRRANLKNHGVDFLDACRIFEGPAVEASDTRRDYGEKRIGAYGEVNGIVLFVIHVWRKGKRRLISARKAGRDERKAYHAAIGG